MPVMRISDPSSRCDWEQRAEVKGEGNFHWSLQRESMKCLENRLDD